MSSEKLLTPRYKVIADYPNSDYHVGEIIKNIGIGYVAFLEDYPHLFKKLEWWEERSTEEMPMYFIGRMRGEDVYLKSNNWIYDTVVKYHTCFVNGFNFSAPYCTPITEEEYNASDAQNNE